MSNRFSQASPTTHTIQQGHFFPHVSQVAHHWSEFADPYVNPDNPFCKVHTRGVCKHGDYCKFRHSLTPAEYYLLFKDEQPNLWTRWPNHPFNAQPVLSNKAYAPVINVASADATGVGPPESFQGHDCGYYSLGKYRNGADCPRMHPQHPPAPDTTNNGCGSPRRDETSLKQQPICKFFKERGTCAKGIYCKYRHDSGDRPQKAGKNVTSDQSGNNNENTGDNMVTEETPDSNGRGNYVGWNGDWANNNQTETTPDWANNVASNNSNWGQPTPYKNPPYRGGHRRDICYAFQAGNCYRGDSCWFSHGDGGSKEEGWPGGADADACPTDYPTSQKLPCSLYKRGNFHGGTSCSLSHDDPNSNEGIHTSVTWEADVDAASGSNIEGPANTSPGEAYHSSNNEPEIAATERFAEEPNMHTTIVEEDVVDILRDEAEESSEEGLAVSPLPPIVFNHPETERTLMNADVGVGPDTMPLSIKTRAETVTLKIANLMRSSFPSEITALARQYGTVLSCLNELDLGFESLIVNIEFAEPEQAYRAYKNLDNTEFGGAVISASLPIKHRPFTRQQNECFSLKVSWLRTVVNAWVRYPTISKARQEETRLDGIIVKGESVTAKLLMKPSSFPPAPSCSVILTNLPAETTKADLDELCPGSDLITLETFESTADSVDQLRYMCGSYGKVKFFDVHQPKTLETVQTAFMTYAKEVSVTKALGALRQSGKLTFLGRQQLQGIQAIHHVSYKISESLFIALESGLESLQDKYKECTLQYGESSTNRGDASHFVRIYAPKDEHGPFGDLNKEVWVLLKGTMLESGGRVWNDYFGIPSSSEALRTIQEATQTFIYRDDRERCVRVYGTPTNQEAAISQVNKLLTEDNAHRHLLMVKRPQLRALMNGGYQKLQDTLSADQVALDISAATLVVRGSSGDLNNAKRILDSLSKDDASVLPVDADKTCTICHLEAEDPILLSCRHRYCTACLKFGISHSDTAPYGCIAPRDGDVTLRCASFVPYVLINDLLTPNDVKKVLVNSFMTHVRADHNLFFCPTPNCLSTHRVREDGVNVICTVCSTEVCTSCRTFAHLGSSCLSMRVSHPLRIQP